MKNLLILNLLLSFAIVGGAVSCKSKKSKTKSGTKVTPSLLSGNWISTKNGNDAIADDAATILQFSGANVSAHGTGPFKLVCPTEQAYTLSGSSIVIAEKDGCAASSIKIEKISSAVFEASEGKNIFTFTKQSDGDVTSMLTKLGLTEAAVAEPFKHFLKGSTANPAVLPAPDNGAAFDAYEWVKLVGLKVSAGATTLPTDAKKPALALYRKIIFQNGAIIATEDAVTKNQGDVSCEVEFGLYIPDEKRIMVAGTEFAMYSVFSGPYSIPFMPSSRAMVGTITMTSKNVVRQIQCRKYGADAIVVGDLRKAMGSFIVIAAK
jgi:hypothetical protein